MHIWAPGGLINGINIHCSIIFKNNISILGGKILKNTDMKNCNVFPPILCIIVFCTQMHRNNCYILNRNIQHFWLVFKHSTSSLCSNTVSILSNLTVTVGSSPSEHLPHPMPMVHISFPPSQATSRHHTKV